MPTEKLKFTNLITLIISICVLIGIVFTAYLYIESRYALATELRLTQLRLDQKIENDTYIDMQRQLRELKKDEKENPSTETEQDIDELKGKIEMQKKKVEEIWKNIEEKK